MQTEFWHWLHSLEPGFAFLLTLPLLVVAAGVLRYWFDRARSRGLSDPAERR